MSDALTAPATPEHSEASTQEASSVVRELRDLVRSAVAPPRVPTGEEWQRVFPYFVRSVAEMVNEGEVSEADALDIIKAFAEQLAQARIGDRFTFFLDGYFEPAKSTEGLAFTYERTLRRAR